MSIPLYSPNLLNYNESLCNSEQKYDILFIENINTKILEQEIKIKILEKKLEFFMKILYISDIDDKLILL